MKIVLAIRALVFFSWFFSFWSFIAIKVGGVSFVAWSWLWAGLPLVPMLALLFKHFGL